MHDVYAEKNIKKTLNKITKYILCKSQWFCCILPFAYLLSQRPWCQLFITNSPLAGPKVRFARENISTVYCVTHICVRSPISTT